MEIRRYRPYFEEWSATLRFEYDLNLLTLEQIGELLERAGFGVGIGTWAPHRDGPCGQFEIVHGTLKEGWS